MTVIGMIDSVVFELYGIEAVRVTRCYVFTVDLDGVQFKTRLRDNINDTINAILSKYLR